MFNGYACDRMYMTIIRNKDNKPKKKRLYKMKRLKQRHANFVSIFSFKMNKKNFIET